MPTERTRELWRPALRRPLLAALAWLALGVAVLGAGNDFWLYVATTVAAYAALAVSLDLVVGQAGLISGCHATFFGVGAYGTALAGERLGLPFALAATVGVAASAVLALGLGSLTLRVSGLYFTLGTMSFGIVFTDILSLPETAHFTGGSVGLPLTSAPEVLGQGTSSFLVFFGLLAVVALAVHLISVSALGRRLRAIRDDEVLAASLGVRTGRHKVAVVTLSGLMAGVVGVFYAPFFGYLNPTQFDIWVSFQVLVWVLLGGSGTIAGPVMGTAVLWILPLQLRLDPSINLVLYGALVIVIMVAYRRGLVGLLEAVVAIPARAGRRLLPALSGHGTRRSL